MCVPPFLSTLLVTCRHRAVFVVAFLVLCGGRPSYGKGALLLSPALLAGVLLASHSFTAAPDQALYYLDGTIKTWTNLLFAIAQAPSNFWLELDKSTLAPKARGDT